MHAANYIFSHYSTSYLFLARSNMWNVGVQEKCVGGDEKGLASSVVKEEFCPQGHKTGSPSSLINASLGGGYAYHRRRGRLAQRIQR